MVSMMFAVGDAPLMVRDKDERMHNVTYEVIERSVAAETLVATIMPNDKKAPESEPLYEGI